MTKKFSLLRMLQNSRESGAINIDCVDPLGELNQPPLGVTSFFVNISLNMLLVTVEYPFSGGSITKKNDIPYYGWHHL